MSKLDLTYAVWDVDGIVGAALESPVDESEYSGTDKHPARLKTTAAVRKTEIIFEYFLCIKIPFRSDYLKGIISKKTRLFYPKKRTYSFSMSSFSSFSAASSASVTSSSPGFTAIFARNLRPIMEKPMRRRIIPRPVMV